MANPLQISGAQPAHPSRKVPLYQGARWTTGLWSNRAPVRDAASTRLEEKFYGPRGDAFLDGQNLEISQKLTLIRRYGNSPWNTNNWTNITSFYELRLFNSNIEQIKTMVDTSTTLYDGSNNGQVAVWTKLAGAGQSYMQSVGNTLFWGDGVEQKKWINTLQTRIPYVETGTSQNPYNFTPFELNSFIIDSNGNAEQLIGTILQLDSFTVLNNIATFTLKTTQSYPFGIVDLPLASEILTSGLQVYFGPTSQVATALGETNGVTLTVDSVSAGQILSASTGWQFFHTFYEELGFPGFGYAVNDIVVPTQTGASGGQLQVTSVGGSGGFGYASGTINTTTDEFGLGCQLSIVTGSGGTVTSFTIATPGTGYDVGDFLIFQPQRIGHFLPPFGENGFAQVTSIGANGAVTGATLLTGVVTGLNVISGGTGYLDSGIIGDIFISSPTPTTGGTGTGLTVSLSTSNDQFTSQVVYDGGPVTSVSIVNRGTGYFVGDVLILTETSQPASSSSPAKLTITNILGAVQAASLQSGGPLVAPYTTGNCTNTTSGSGQFASFSITTVSGGQVTGVSILNPGIGYNVGDAIYLTQGSAAGAVLTVATLIGGAPNGIATVSISRGGYTAYTVGTGVATNTSGIGTGCTINITSVSNGQITGFTINASGSNYTVGDFLYPTQGGAAGAILQVTQLTGTVISAITLDSAGTGYPSDHPLPTTGGHGSGAQITLQFVSLPPHGGHYIASIYNGGAGYDVNDVLTLVYAGASGGTVTVTGVSSAAGPIAAVSLTNSGFGYVTENNIPATGGNGSGAVFDLVVANPDFLPPTAITDTPTVFQGGNPISDSRLNNQVAWSGVGQTTIDGSALWYNRGAAIDGGLVYNWGIQSGTNTPTIVVNNAEDGWVADTYYSQTNTVIVTVSSSKYLQQVVTAGKAGGSAPNWSTIPGQLTTDGTVQWICLGNDSDTTLNWAASTTYSVGHLLENTVGGVSCVFQLQPYVGIRTVGSSFPAYCWQCNSQSGTDVGAAGEIPSGGGNAPMAQNGGQTTTTATYVGTMDSFFLTTGGSPVTTSSVSGNGTVSGSPSGLFAGSQNLSIAMLPTLIIPAAGVYTFQIGHQNAMFWGIGNGSLDLNVTRIQVQGNVLTVTCDTNISNSLSAGIQLTFSGIVSANFLNGQTITVLSVGTNSFTADFTHANYGPAKDSGLASSGATLSPVAISGPVIWPSTSNPNHYNFSTGTPIKGYPIMSANYPSQGTSLVVDTVQVSFPSAGVYPCEIQQGFWYHSISGYSTPTVSPALPGTTFGFYMIYQPAAGSTWYNIIPDGIACTSASAPSWPSFPTTLAGMQAIAPAYPSVEEASGNYLWWNLGPTSAFGWTAAVNYTTETFIIDQNTVKEIAYVPGVSGTSVPAFSTTLYGLVADVPPLVWMNDGPVGSSPFGTLETTQGGWKYAVALVDTLDDTVSNASTVSVSTGNFFGATGVYISGGLPNIIDPQADYVAIFRTQDGGANYYLIPPPASGNGNTEYTVPLAQYLSSGFTDTTLDTGLNFLFQAPLAYENTPPKLGSINCAYQDNRIFVSVGNTVYWSSGPDTPIGNGFNGFNPVNYAEFPSKVTKLVPLNAGMFVFTISDIYLISGNGTANAPFSSQPFIQKLGLLSYNALTVNGSIIYMLSTDKQAVELNVHSGLSHVGTPIADLLSKLSPSQSYLTWHVSGEIDQCLFLADGSTGWYRMSPTAAPENGTLNWSLKANIVGGTGAVQSVETTPGNIQLLLAPPPNVTGPILFRDYTTFADNGTPYLANFILGSLVLAYPGEAAAVEFITTDAIKAAGSRPISLAIRIGEIAGVFENLDFWTNDPPQLPPSETLYAQRFYLSQTKQPAVMRHMQIEGNFAATNSADELMTLTVFGGFNIES